MLICKVLRSDEWRALYAEGEMDGAPDLQMRPIHRSRHRSVLHRIAHKYRT